MSRANLLAVACLSYLIGVFLDSFIFFRQIWPVFLLVFLGLITIRLIKKKSILPLIIGCLFVVGGFYHHSQSASVSNSHSVNGNGGKTETVTVYGTVHENFIGASGRQKVVVEIDKIISGSKEVKAKEERVMVTVFTYPRYWYGNYLKMTGQLTTPPVFSGFNYRDYLKKDRIYFLMYWPQVELIEVNRGNIIKGALLAVTNRLQAENLKWLSPPQSALLSGLVFGNDSGFSKAWEDRFNLTATRHITAVSGMNITLISFIILDLLLFFGFWRQSALVIITVIIILYVLMIGAPLSAIRAGIMAIIVFGAQLLGRYANPSRALLFAITAMVLFNPLILMSDIGFQLSFLAIFGIISFQPFINERLVKLPNILSLRTTLASTLAAQITTMPLIVYNFGSLSLIGPISNILITPLIPIITIIGFVFIIGSIIAPLIGQVISWFLWLLLSYVLTVIRLLADLPLVAIKVNNLSPLIIAFSYGIIGYIAWQIKKKEQRKFIGG